MHDLIVVGFRGEGRATEVLTELLQLAYDGTIDLFDGVAAHRTDDGRLRIDESIQPLTREGAGWGAIWGVWLGALIVGPFTTGLSLAVAAASTAAAAAGTAGIGAIIGGDNAAMSKAKHGLSEDFVTQVGEMIKSDDSGVFAILETKNRDRVIETFRGYGGTVLRTTLAPDVVKRVQSSLDA
jgi:uncharacterized membrane protein